MISKKDYFSSFGDSGNDDVQDSVVIIATAKTHEYTPPVVSFEMPPIPEVPVIEDCDPINYTREELKNKSSIELESILVTDHGPNKYLPASVQSLINTELLLRSINKPEEVHWSSIAALIVSVISMVFCGMAVRSDIQKWFSHPHKADPAIQSTENSHQLLLEPEISPQLQVPQTTVLKSSPLDLDRPDASKIQKQDRSPQKPEEQATPEQTLHHNPSTTPPPKN